MDAEALRARIRDVPDFPKPGILFRDITPLFLDPVATRTAVELMIEPFRSEPIDRVVGIESRGFLMGVPVAQALGVGFGLVRKEGKLPASTHQAEYALEYGTDVVEMHRDCIEPGQRVLLVDDLIATGGTAAAAIELVERAGGVLVGGSFLIELEELRGREKLALPVVHTVIRY